DKMHFFGSYEYEREPATLFTSNSALPGQTFTQPYKVTQSSILARVDDQLNPANRLTVRGSRWDWENPFVLASGGHPSNASVQTKNATNIGATWSRVISDSKVQEIRVGYNNFEWTNNPEPGQDTVEYD